MAKGIARTLTAGDPANAAYYRRNLSQTRARLIFLNRNLQEILSKVEGAYTVFNDAYQYLEHRCGLRSMGAITTHPERSPGAGHLSA